MSKVITFSTQFPSYHPRAGEPTKFVEKIWESLIQLEEISISRCCELSRETGIGNYTMNSIRKINFEPKFHTVREGNRFKEGEWFSPRIWSGCPYNSKQITIAPDIQIKKVWDVQADEDGCFWVISDHDDESSDVLDLVAKNDGLDRNDFMNWFSNPFIGQIICWNENIEY